MVWRNCLAVVNARVEVLPRAPLCVCLCFPSGRTSSPRQSIRARTTRTTTTKETRELWQPHGVWEPQDPGEARELLEPQNYRSLTTRIGKRWRRTRARGSHGGSLFPVSVAWSMPRSIATPPGRDASPSQGYTPAVCHRYPFYTWMKRDKVE